MVSRSIEDTPDTNEEFVGILVFDDGTSEGIPIEEVRKVLTGPHTPFDDSVLEVTRVGEGGLLRLDVHGGPIYRSFFDGDTKMQEDNLLPLVLGGADGLRMDVPYFIPFTPGCDSKDVEEAPLMACRDALVLLEADSWTAFPIELDIYTEDGSRAPAAPDSEVDLFKEGGKVIETTIAGAGIDVNDFAAFVQNETGEVLRFRDLSTALLVLEASYNVAAQMIERHKSPAPAEVPLAQFSKNRLFQNHGLAFKSLDGLFNIAAGATSHVLVPRSGNSLEKYVLTASEDACFRLFQISGANTEQVRAILSTVYSLKKDPRSAEFVYEGRVWFSTNKIVEELLRTSAGTVRGSDNETAHELVERTLEAVSGAQIKGTTPDGSTTKILYLLDAVRLDEVTHNGEVYRDVWGFSVSQETLAEYAESIGQAYSYPLPSREKPFTIQSVAVNEYLSDALNQARDRLYFVNKKGRFVKRRGISSFTITRAWQGGDRGIFELFSPARELDSRQKDRLVRMFEEELTNLVREESHGGRRNGGALYVRAWSERDGSRGRGKGAYRNLVLEVTSSFRAVRDGEAGHGCVNLRDGISKAAPDNAHN